MGKGNRSPHAGVAAVRAAVLAVHWQSSYRFRGERLDPKARACLAQLAQTYGRSGEARVIRLVALAAGRRPRSAAATRVVELASCARRPAWGLEEGRRSARGRPPRSRAGNAVRVDWLRPIVVRPGLAAVQYRRRIVPGEASIMDFELGCRPAGVVVEVVGIRGSRVRLSCSAAASWPCLASRSMGPTCRGVPSKPNSIYLPGSRPSRFLALAASSCGPRAVEPRPRSCRSRFPQPPTRPNAGSFVWLDDSPRLALPRPRAACGAGCPCLISWDAARHRKRLSWRVLTVARGFSGVRSRRRIRRSRELGQRRYAGHLPQSRSPRPALIPGISDEGQVPGRQVHERGQRRTPRQPGLRLRTWLCLEGLS